MFQAMFSPIIKNTLLYLQYLVVFTHVAAGWCPKCVETETPNFCVLKEIRLAGLAARMVERRGAHRTLVGRTEKKRNTWKTMRRRKENIKRYFKEIAQDGVD